MDAHIMNEIDFGYGLLGRIEKGGTFQIAREQVSDTGGRPAYWMSTSPDAWSSSKPSTRISDEVRSAFKPVQPDLSVQDAVALLDAAAAP